MNKDNFITDVIFRKEKEGTILAVFPYVINDNSGNVVCFSLSEAHNGASWDYVLQNTIPANEKEYNDTKKHLEKNYGYNFKVIKKRNYNRYLSALYEIRNKK